MTVQEFFEQLPSKVDPAKTAGMNNSFVFDIEDVGQWTVTVDDGTVSVAEGAGEADCTISASEETLVKIAQGEANPTTAYMSRQAQDRRRHGRRVEAPEAVLASNCPARFVECRPWNGWHEPVSPGASTCSP